MWFPIAILCIVLVTKAQIPPTTGPYAVKDAEMYVGTYVADGKRIQTARIFWPVPKTAGEKFPFLVFMHGMGGGGTRKIVQDYKRELLDKVASWGFIIVGPESCLTSYCREFYQDGVNTVLTLSKNISMHPALATADFSKLGVFGHSMGGDATVHLSNRPSGVNFLGGVALHPSLQVEDFSKGVKAPLWYATGTRDTLAPPTAVIKGYGTDPTKPKFLAEITGAGHMEPTTGQPNRWTPYIIKYFLCHVAGDKEACPFIYGQTSSSFCGQTEIPMTRCESTE